MPHSIRPVVGRIVWGGYESVIEQAGRSNIVLMERYVEFCVWNQQFAPHTIREKPRIEWGTQGYHVVRTMMSTAQFSIYDCSTKRPRTRRIADFINWSSAARVGESRRRREGIGVDVLNGRQVRCGNVFSPTVAFWEAG
jgi:hypothetical protein